MLRRGFWRDRRGAAAVEFAFLAPVMIALFFGTVELSRGLSARGDVVEMASAAADLIAQESATSSDDISNVYSAASTILYPYYDTSKTGTQAPSIRISSIIDNGSTTSGKVAWTCSWTGSGSFTTALTKGGTATIPSGLITAGSGGGTTLKTATGGSVTNLFIARGGALNAVLTIAAGDGGGGAKTGSKGGDVKNVSVNDLDGDLMAFVFVADQVPVHVVDALEIVQVDEGHRQRPAVAYRQVELVLQGGAELVAVVDTGQRIAAGLLGQVARGTELQVRVHPDLLDDIEARIADRQSRDRRKLNLTVVPDETIALGDARIGWEEGGLALDASARRRAVAEELETLLKQA